MFRFFSVVVALTKGDIRTHLPEQPKKVNPCMEIEMKGVNCRIRTGDDGVLWNSQGCFKER